MYIHTWIQKVCTIMAQNLYKQPRHRMCCMLLGPRCIDVCMYIYTYIYMCIYIYRHSHLYMAHTHTRTYTVWVGLLDPLGWNQKLLLGLRPWFSPGLAEGPPAVSAALGRCSGASQSPICKGGIISVIINIFLSVLVIWR